MSQPTSTNLKLRPETRQRLEAFALRTHRTLTASADMLLNEALDAVDEAIAADTAEGKARRLTNDSTLSGD